MKVHQIPFKLDFHQIWASMPLLVRITWTDDDVLEEPGLVYIGSSWKFEINNHKKASIEQGESSLSGYFGVNQALNLTGFFEIFDNLFSWAVLFW